MPPTREAPPYQRARNPGSTSYDQYTALNEVGKYQEALPFAEEALRLGERQFGENGQTTLLFLINLGELYITLGDYAKAEPLLKRALEINEKALGPDHPHVAARLNNLGLLYEALGEYAKAEPL
ncbi:MAG: tetratricopeptide repeat protein, partial [Planctomycetia bacterium]|nr:tetratricopeptide repeat protein [Planctomycetia bacterium]